MGGRKVCPSHLSFLRLSRLIDQLYVLNPSVVGTQKRVQNEFPASWTTCEREMKGTRLWVALHHDFHGRDFGSALSLSSERD